MKDTKSMCDVSLLSNLGPHHQQLCLVEVEPSMVLVE